MPEQDERNPALRAQQQLLRAYQAKLAALQASAGQAVSSVTRPVGRALDWANTPLVNVPGWPEGVPMPRVPGALPGTNAAIKVMPGMLSEMTTPASLATLAATGGSSLLGRGALGQIARGSQAVRAGVDLAQAGQGVRTSVQGVREGKPGQVAAGAGMAVLGGLGLSRSAPPMMRPHPGPLGPGIDPARLLNHTTSSQIVKDTLANGGHSNRLAPRAAVQGDLGGTVGHAVGIAPESEFIAKPGAFSEADLDWFVRQPEQNRLLQHPGAHLGTWHVAAADATPRYPTGSTVIDMGMAPKPEALGMDLAKLTNQKAIFRLQDFTQLDNPAYDATRRMGSAMPYAQRLRKGMGEPENWREALIAALKTRSGRSQ